MKKIILTLSLLVTFITVTPAQQVKHDSIKTLAPADSLNTKPKPKTKYNSRHHKHSSIRWSRMNRQIYQARIHEAANKKAQALQDEYAKRHAVDTARY